MKKKDLNDLRNKEAGELVKLLGKRSLEIMKVRAKSKVAKEKNLKRVKNLKREVAQIKTLIREKELIGESSEKEKEEGGK